MSNVRKCVVCGNNYRYCPNCSQYKNKPSWYSLYCSENCKDINYLFRDYNSKSKSMSELRKTLQTCDLSRKEYFREDIKKMIKNLNGGKRKKKK